MIDALVSAGWVRFSETPGLAYGTVLAFGAPVAMPVLFALDGFEYGAVAAILYNLAIRLSGKTGLPRIKLLPTGDSAPFYSTRRNMVLLV